MARYWVTPESPRNPRLFDDTSMNGEENIVFNPAWIEPERHATILPATLSPPPSPPLSPPPPIPHRFPRQAIVPIQPHEIPPPRHLSDLTPLNLHDRHWNYLSDRTRENFEMTTFNGSDKNHNNNNTNIDAVVIVTNNHAIDNTSINSNGSGDYLTPIN